MKLSFGASLALAALPLLGCPTLTSSATVTRIVDDAGMGSLPAPVLSASSVVSVDAGPRTPPVILVQAQRAVALAISGGDLYWTRGPTEDKPGQLKKDGAVMRVSVEGGASVPVVTGVSYIEQIAATPTSLYFAEPPPGSVLLGSEPNGGVIRVMPLDGGAPKTFVPKQSLVAGFALDDENLYYIASTLPGARPVVSVPLKGGKPTPLGELRGAEGLAVDGSGIYVATGDPDGIYMIARDGGAALPLAFNQLGPAGIAVDATAIYWTNNEGGTVMKLAKGEKKKPTTLCSDQEVPRAVAVDAGFVYWGNEGEGETHGSIVRCAVTGCGKTPTVLAADLASPVRIALDATSVYWTNERGDIMKVAK